VTRDLACRGVSSSETQRLALPSGDCHPVLPLACVSLGFHRLRVRV
jgi:hypothetical protein